MQSHHHQGLSLLPPSDLTEHRKLNKAAESQTEENMLFLSRNFIDSIYHYFFKNFLNVG